MAIPDGDTLCISWKAVSELLRQVENGHCCDIRLEMKVPHNGGTGVQFWLTACAEPRIVGRKTIRAPMRQSHRWPTTEAVTLAALAFQLLYKLDAALEEAGHLPAEQADFLWAAQS